MAYTVTIDSEVLAFDLN